MARLTLTTGLCPVCGDEVTRTVSIHHGIASEAYHCPVHGRRAASPSGMAAADWATPTMSTLGEVLGYATPAPWVR